MDNDKTDFKQKISVYMKDWASVAKKRWWIYLVELAVLAVILVADLLTKQYAWEYLNQQGVKDGFIPGLINLVMVENRGAGFGIFQGKTVGLTVITFIVIVAICIYLFFALKESEWLRISLVFVIAGGIGNIVDRIAFGYVRDFIQFSFWENFPVFNIADSFVTVGAFMLVIVLIIMLVQEGKKNQKEFEEEQKNKVENEQEQIDPLDAPINLNSMMKSDNEFDFVVSEKKEENTTENEDNNHAEKDDKQVENEEIENADDSSDCDVKDTDESKKD